MDPEGTSVIRFGARWAQVTEATLPYLDVEKGIERLLHEKIVRRRWKRRGHRLRRAASALTGTGSI